MEGSVVQGLGWALTEGFDYGPDGHLRNASLLDYRMPTALDVPKIDCIIIETPVPKCALWRSRSSAKCRSCRRPLPWPTRSPGQSARA